MQRSNPIFKQKCSSHSCMETAAPGDILCDLHISAVKNPIKCTTKFCTDDCIPAQIHCSVHLYKSNGPICEHGDCRTIITTGKRYCYSHEHHVAAVGERPLRCESVSCDDDCVADSIYCLTHTCFPDQIIYNDDYIEDQKKIEKQIEEQKQIMSQINAQKHPTYRTHYTPLKTESDTLSRLSAPIGYVTADDYSIYDKYHSKYQDDEYPDTVPRYSLYEECQQAYDNAYEASKLSGVSFMLDINRTCIRPDCKRSSLFYGKVCVEHKCLYCHESAVLPVRFCLFHLPSSFLHCVGHNINESEFLPQFYLAKLPPNILGIIVDIIKNNQENSVGYLGVD